MSNETQTPSAVPSSEPNPWTAEDVEVLARAVLADQLGVDAEEAEGVWLDLELDDILARRADTRAVLAALAPRLVERERAAAAKALRDEAAQIVDPDVKNWLQASANKIERGER